MSRVAYDDADFGIGIDIGIGPLPAEAEAKPTAKPTSRRPFGRDSRSSRRRSFVQEKLQN